MAHRVFRRSRSGRMLEEVGCCFRRLRPSGRLKRRLPVLAGKRYIRASLLLHAGISIRGMLRQDESDGIADERQFGMSTSVLFPCLCPQPTGDQGHVSFVMLRKGLCPTAKGLAV